MTTPAATDSTLHYPCPFTDELSHIDNAPVATSLIASTHHIDNFASGLTPTQRPLPPSQDSGVLSIIIATLLLFSFNINRSRRLVKAFTQNLWSTRRRENAFDEHTSTEARSMIALIVSACVFQALMLFTAVTANKPTPPQHPATLFALITSLTIIYYLLQTVAYHIIGTTFTDKPSATQWLKGFNAAHSLSGILLMIPTLAALFYPTSQAAMLTLSATLYFTARVIFICKGFRIFYHNFGSLLYFILYLCTLEIIPVIWIYSGATFLVDFLM